MKTKYCLFCKGTHQIYSCNDFKQCFPQERKIKAQELEIGFNCLSNYHGCNECAYRP